MKSEKAVYPLIHSLQDEDSGWMAAIALGKLQSEKAIAQLLVVLNEKNTKKRRAAAWALGKIPSEKAVHSLIAALKDKDAEVRMWAAEALIQIGSQESLNAVKKHKNRMNGF
jgi:HEAT repeat protein